MPLRNDTNRGMSKLGFLCEHFSFRNFLALMAVLLYILKKFKCKCQSKATQPMKVPLIPMSNKSYNIIVDILILFYK